MIKKLMLVWFMQESHLLFVYSLFYCSLNAGLFELWYFTIDNVETNLKNKLQEA